MSLRFSSLQQFVPFLCIINLFVMSHKMSLGEEEGVRQIQFPMLIHEIPLGLIVVYQVTVND